MFIIVDLIASPSYVLSSTDKLKHIIRATVLMAELLKLYYPRYVELHNYVPASNLNMKKENWNTLNRKVLAKLNMRLNKDMIHCLANASQGMIEKLLLELRIKVLTDGVEMQKPRLVKNDIENVEQMSSNQVYLMILRTVSPFIFLNMFFASQRRKSKAAICCTMTNLICPKKAQTGSILITKFASPICQSPVVSNEGFSLSSVGLHISFVY